MKKIALCILLLSLVLTSCAKEPPPQLVTITEVEMVVVYPPFVMACTEAPDLPAVVTGQTVGEWVLRMDAAYNDCRSTLASIDAWIAREKRQRKKDVE